MGLLRDNMKKYEKQYEIIFFDMNLYEKVLNKMKNYKFIFI